MSVIVLLLLILISVWVGFYQLVKQYGRLLLRLDQLERGPRDTPETQPENAREETEPAGIPIGTTFPSFSFPDLNGKMVALGDFHGMKVLLVHWNFECGFCDSIAPELARLEHSFQRSNVQLVLLAYGDAKSNREQSAEHGLSCPILLMKDQETSEPFEQHGTPAAYLLDEEGRVATAVASGSHRVLSLAQIAAKGLGPSETLGRHRISLPGLLGKQEEIGLGDVIKRVTSAIGIKPCLGCEQRAAVLNRWMVFPRVRRGRLKAGKRAPVFQLPDLYGRTVSLKKYRGRQVLLVFSDPQCGPCDELAPHLARLHQEHANNGLAVVLVGRGNVEENRSKAEQHGFEFPVLIQDRKWKISKQYGMLATPAAFLIGKDGAIVKEAAVGTDAVLALVRDGARQKREA